MNPIQFANILHEAADKIEAVCDADKVSSAPIPELPSKPALPDPPEGFHPAMMGPIKGAAKESRDVAGISFGEWVIGYNGDCIRPYALRKGSDIARLNGLEPEAIPADKEPEPVKPWEQPCPKCGGPHWSTNCPTSEPVKRREWCASVCRADGEIFHRDNNDNSKRWELVQVREVLPGDPTMEQVEALVRTLQNAFTFRVTNHPTWEAEARKALQPFTGKDKP